MEPQTHDNSNDHHIIDIRNDDDSSSSDERSYSPVSSSSIGNETSDEGSTSSSSSRDIFWNTMELVITLAQIVVALLVLNLAKDEQPDTILLTWLIGYYCGCVTLILIISIILLNFQVRVMKVLKMVVECFFFVWLFLGTVWIGKGHSSPSDAPTHYGLFVLFIAYSSIRYTYAVLLYADPLIRDSLEGGISFERPSHEDCCCICLGEYEEEERIVIRKLECSHVFHLECINKWLRIKATCPLRQSLVR